MGIVIRGKDMNGRILVQRCSNNQEVCVNLLDHMIRIYVLTIIQWEDIVLGSVASSKRMNIMGW